jgi:HK97 family phage prohead protease
MQTKLNHRQLSFSVSNFEVKEADGGGEITGYASVYGNVDNGGDVVVQGAFDTSIKAYRDSGRRMKMLWQHDPAQPIGVWNELSSDSKGLLVKGRILPEVQRGKEALALVRAGAIEGLSIGYRVKEPEYRDTERGTIRYIKEAELWETSLVTFPMNEEAGVTDVKRLQSPREVEHLLRDAGVPGGFAKLIALHGYEGATKRLSGDSRDAGDAEAKREAIQALISNLNGLKEILNG